MGLDAYLYAGKDKKQIGYWRKFLTLDLWFYDHIHLRRDMDGIMHYIPVTRKQLENLRDTIDQALDGPESLKLYFPKHPYDDVMDFNGQLQYTKDVLDAALDSPETAFFYRNSY